MSAAVFAEPITCTLDATDDTLSHYYCCDPHRALCGTDLDGVGDDGEDGDVECVVCVSLEASMLLKPCQSATCPKRGAA
jgi:hypothetical protein